MTRIHLNKLWTAIGLALAFYMFNAWSASRGGALLFKMVLLDERKVPNAYFSIIVIGLLSALASMIGRLYALQSNAAPTRFDRWPVIGLTDLDMRAPAAKAYQSFFLILILILPLASLIHFWRIVIDDGALFWKKEVVLSLERGAAAGGATGVDQLQRRNGSAPAYGSPLVLPLHETGALPAALTIGGGYCIGEWQNGDQGLLDRVLIPKARAAAKGAAAETVEVDHDPCKDGADGAWRGGVEWVPILSPVALSLATMLASVAAAMFATEIVKSRKEEEEEGDS